MEPPTRPPPRFIPGMSRRVPGKTAARAGPFPLTPPLPRLLRPNPSALRQDARSAVRVSFTSTSGLFLRQRPVQAQPSWGLRP